MAFFGIKHTRRLQEITSVDRISLLVLLLPSAEHVGGRGIRTPGALRLGIPFRRASQARLDPGLRGRAKDGGECPGLRGRAKASEAGLKPERRYLA